MSLVVAVGLVLRTVAVLVAVDGVVLAEDREDKQREDEHGPEHGGGESSGDSETVRK